VRAVFVDKDGTLVENVPYNVDPAQIALTPGAADGIAALARHGYRVIVISNQPGVGLGKFPLHALDAVQARLADLVTLDGFYFCPHAPNDGCDCRKPAPGLIERAAREHGVSLSESWLVGDILDDIEAGRRAGCRTVLLDNGNETEWQVTPERRPHHVARDLGEAAALILEQ
jgi:D-glycero-D-manno-heptose 1,7-bisphosphate phosphatase